MMAVKTQEQSHTSDDTYCTILVKILCKYETPEANLI